MLSQLRLPGNASPLYVLPGLHDAVLLTALAVLCTLLPFALSLVTTAILIMVAAWETLSLGMLKHDDSTGL